MKVSGKKILIECELPTDYGLCRTMEHKGLPSLTCDSFYVLTNDKKFVVREYEENGFSYIDKEIEGLYNFDIVGKFHGGMGLWEVTYGVITDSGKIKNLYEKNCVIKDMY